MHIAVFTKNLTNPAYMAARLGADRAAARLGARTTHHVPRIPDDVAQQTALIDEVLGGPRPDAIVLSPVHSSAVGPAIRRIHAACIPIVSLITPVQAVPVASFVHSDDYALALGIARRLFEHLGGRGDVLVVSGHEDSYTSLERLRGFGDAAASYPGIVLRDTVAGDYIRDVASQRTRAWLAAHPSTRIDACLVANDIMAVGVLEALRAARRHAAVVGVNAIPEAIAAIQRGELLATADFNAMRMAHLAAECAVRHLRGEAVPRHIELPVDIVDAHNCHLWDMPYAERTVWTLDEARAEIARAGSGRME